MVKRLTVAGLALMLSWNVVFGVFGKGVLCLHKEISAHLELEPEAQGPCQVDWSAGAERMSARDECPPCIDIEIQSESFESTPALELLKVPAPLHEEEPHIFSRGLFPSPSGALERACPTRGPPVQEAQSLIVARTHVLRV